MAINYREILEDTRPGKIDFHNKRVAARTFRADTSDPVSAQLAVDEKEGGINSPYPGDPGLIVDSIDWKNFGGVCTDIIYSYSSDRRASLPPRVNKDRTGYYSFRESDTTAEIEFPYALRVLTTMPANAGDAPTKRKLWTIFDDRKIVEPRSMLAVNLQVSGWSLTKRAAVQAQTSKVHTIGGVEYVFKGADVNQRTDSSANAALYDVTYSWIADPGTPGVDLGSYDTTQEAFPIFNRPPFYKYIAVPNPSFPPDDPAGVPLFRTRPNFDRVPDGWRTLPSIPNL